MSEKDDKDDIFFYQSEPKNDKIFNLEHHDNLKSILPRAKEKKQRKVSEEKVTWSQRFFQDLSHKNEAKKSSGDFNVKEMDTFKNSEMLSEEHVILFPENSDHKSRTHDSKLLDLGMVKEKIEDSSHLPQEPDVELYKQKLAASRARYLDNSTESGQRLKRSPQDFENEFEDKTIQTKPDPRLIGLVGDPFDDLPKNAEPVQNIQKNKVHQGALNEYNVAGEVTRDQPEDGNYPDGVPGVSIVEDHKAKESIQGLFVYLTFLITVSVIVFSTTSRSAFYMTNAVSSGFMDTQFPLNIPSEENATNVEDVNPTASTAAPGPATQRTNVRHITDKYDNASHARKSDAPSATFITPPVADKKTKYDSKMKNRTVRQQSAPPQENSDSGPDLLEYPAGGISLRNAVSVRDFWNFMNTTFLTLLYSEFLQSYKDPLLHTEEDDRSTFYSSVLLGVARIRQLRVTSASCSIHPQMSHLFDECFGYYSESTESREDIPGLTTDAWIFTPPEKLGTVSYSGTFGRYGRGGFVVDLSLNKSVSASRITELKDNGWISQATRAVIIDFTIFNSNVNLFLVCKILVEFPPTGGIYPEGHFNALKFLRYVSAQDMVVLGFEQVFVLFVAVNTLLIMRQMLQNGLKYFKNGWNILDIVILGVSYAAIIMEVYRYVVIESLAYELLKVTDTHPEFDFPCVIQLYFDHLCAFLLFFIWVRLFKFLRFFKNFEELNRTMLRSSKNIASFTVIFLVVFLAFVQWAYLIFGSEVEEYRTAWSSAIALLQAVIGRFNYKQLEESNYLLAPVFLIFYVFFVFFITLNIFEAIIFDSYRFIKSQRYISNEPSAGKYLMTAAANIITLGQKRKPLSAQSSEIAIVTGKKIHDALKRAGYTQTEVDIFFAKYGLKIDQEFTNVQARELQSRLEEHTDDNVDTIAELKKEVEVLKVSLQRYHEEAEDIRKRLKMK